MSQEIHDLSVYECQPRAKSGYLAPVGWYVGVMFNGEWHALGSEKQCLRMPRKVDAEMAMAALVRAGLVNADKLMAVSLKRCKEIMCEALQW